MSTTLLWASQQLIPPLLLTYFYAAWKLCTFQVGPYISGQPNRPLLGLLYICLPTLLIGPITLLYLRLYFLPRNQSVPPHNPPADIRNHKVIFECLSPAEAEVIRRAGPHLDDDDVAPTAHQSISKEPLVNRCYKGRCNGRWKPARARHCSQCGICRGGFDHHCPFFANCLTAPYMPAFLALLLYTPVAVCTLSIPLYQPLYRKSLAAYAFATQSQAIKTGWWDWWASWIMVGGPIGRYGAGLMMGWRELDRLKDGGIDTLWCGVIVAFGHVLALICLGLAYNAMSAILAGDLLMDQSRGQMHMRAILAVQKLERLGQPVPPEAMAEVARWSDTKYFFVPSTARDHGVVIDGPGEGAIVRSEAGERVYDHGPMRNWELVMGSRWRWLLPWRAVHGGVGDDRLFNWPVSERVQGRLRKCVLYIGHESSDGRHL